MKYLDSDSDIPTKTINKEGIITFNYLMRLYKSINFWKRVKFESYRIEMLKDRRGALMEKEMEKYNEICDKLIMREIMCYDSARDMILSEVDIPIENYKKSLELYMDEKDQIR